MWRSKSCRKCEGDQYPEYECDDWVCIQCGYREDMTMPVTTQKPAPVFTRPLPKYEYAERT